MLHRLARLASIAALVAVACSAPARTTTPPSATPPSAAPPPPGSPPAAAGPPAAAAPPAAPPPFGEANYLALSGFPAMHLFPRGIRHVEFRSSSGAIQLRIHDVAVVPGIGIDSAAPSEHRCTPWETFPPALASRLPPDIRHCRDARAACDAVEAWLRATQPVPPPGESPERAAIRAPTFGRAVAPCTPP
ncbi:MAG: hypothetical protein ACTHU0_33820 [Kofleriaceae bacterium]